MFITATEVAEYLGVPEDDRMAQAAAAVCAEVTRVRYDLDLTVDAPAQVFQGSLLWAAELYQTYQAPTGFAGYGDIGTDVYGPIAPSRFATISRMVGLNRPLAL